MKSLSENRENNAFVDSRYSKTEDAGTMFVCLYVYECWGVMPGCYSFYQEQKHKGESDRD